MKEKTERQVVENQIQDDFETLQDLGRALGNLKIPNPIINLAVNLINAEEKNLQENLGAVIQAVSKEMKDFPVNLQINLFLGKDGGLAFQNQQNLSGGENQWNN